MRPAPRYVCGQRSASGYAIDASAASMRIGPSNKIGSLSLTKHWKFLIWLLLKKVGRSIKNYFEIVVAHLTS